MNDYISIIETVNKIFIYSDTHQWEGLLNEVFAEVVLLDYTSFVGGEAAESSAMQVVDNWKAFLPGFKATHHQLGNHQIKITDNKASVFCYGTASHYLPNPSNQNLWWVVGTYDVDLEKMAKGWRVVKMKFNFKYQDGNVDLPKLATGGLQESQ